MMICAFLCNGVIFGIHNSGGSLFVDLKEKYGEDSSKGALVVSLGTGATFGLSAISSLLADKYGIQKTALFGAILAFLGMLLSAFAVDRVRVYKHIASKILQFHEFLLNFYPVRIVVCYLWTNVWWRGQFSLQSFPSDIGTLFQKTYGHCQRVRGGWKFNIHHCHAPYPAGLVEKCWPSKHFFFLGWPYDFVDYFCLEFQAFDA